MAVDKNDLRTRLAGYSGYGDLAPDEAIELFESARAICPIAHSDELGGFYMVFSYEDVKALHMDGETFSSACGMVRPTVDRLMVPPTEFDNPTHDMWRKGVFDKVLNARTPRLVEEAVRREASMLVDALTELVVCDLVSDFADLLPLRAICHVIGFDIEIVDDLARLTREAVTNLTDPGRAAAAFRAFGEFGTREIEKRRQHPRDDFLTTLLDAELDGRRLTDEELGQTFVSVVSGGDTTLVAALVDLLYEVLMRPDVKQQLVADFSLIPAAVEETLRLHPARLGFYRNTTKAVTIHGVDIPEGYQVFLCHASANRDPSVFDDATTFRLDRKHNPHLTFGRGPHTCIGAPTARMELRVALEELLKRVPGIELIEPDSVKHEFGAFESVQINSLPAVIR